MGLSFHDQDSLEEVTSSLCFAPDHPNQNPETESINIGHQESRDDDIGRVQSSEEIQMVDR
jgi:hypothetical protein